MIEESKLNAPQQLDAVVKLALEHGYRRAADMVSLFREEKYPVRDWELGACAWCETEGKRRKATHLDIGSGTPECDRCGQVRTSADTAEMPERAA